MSLADCADSSEIVKQFGKSDKDTGSTEVQIALLTRRIQHLSEDHFPGNTKDIHSRRGMLRLISQRKKLLSYLRRKDVNRYRTILQKLDLRK